VLINAFVVCVSWNYRSTKGVLQKRCGVNRGRCSKNSDVDAAKFIGNCLAEKKDFATRCHELDCYEKIAESVGKDSAMGFDWWWIRVFL